MKYICEKNFEINDVLVGVEGDLIEVTNAIPKLNETIEDVNGYCDITNLTSNQKFEATWMDIDDTILKVL